MQQRIAAVTSRSAARDVLVVRRRGDRQPVLAQHGADRLDTPSQATVRSRWSACSRMNSTISGRAGRARPRRKPRPPSGSRSRGAARRSLVSAACTSADSSLVTPGRAPSSTSARRTHLRTVSGGAHPEQLRHLRHRRPVRVVIGTDLGEHPHRPLLQLRRVPPGRVSRHDSNLPKVRSLPTCRGGSDSRGTLSRPQAGRITLHEYAWEWLRPTGAPSDDGRSDGRRCAALRRPAPGWHAARRHPARGRTEVGHAATSTSSPPPLFGSHTASCRASSSPPSRIAASCPTLAGTKACEGHQAQGPADHRGASSPPSSSTCPGATRPWSSWPRAPGCDRAKSSASPSTGWTSSGERTRQPAAHQRQRARAVLRSPKSQASVRVVLSEHRRGRARAPTSRTSPRRRSSSPTAPAPPSAGPPSGPSGTAPSSRPACRRSASTSCGTTTPRCSSATASPSRPSRPVWARQRQRDPRHLQPPVARQRRAHKGRRRRSPPKFCGLFAD